MRRIDYPKLEAEKETEGYTYFFRHCRSTRLCVKLHRAGGGNKNLLYGYNGMGLHRSHPSWWLLAVRSRSAGLTARLLHVLGLNQAPRATGFINAVSHESHYSYDQCMQIIGRNLAARGDGLWPDGASSARTTSTASTACQPSVPAETVAASTDESAGSEDLDGDDDEEAPEWPEEGE